MTRASVIASEQECHPRLRLQRIIVGPQPVRVPLQPDDIAITKPARCRYCQAAFGDADHALDARYDKIDVHPVVTRVARYAGHCRCCGAITLAAMPDGLEPGTPVSLNIVAMAI
jgi:hypothetical protein